MLHFLQKQINNYNCTESLKHKELYCITNKYTPFLCELLAIFSLDDYFFFFAPCTFKIKEKTVNLLSKQKKLL